MNVPGESGGGDEPRGDGFIEGTHIKRDVALAPLTTMGIGGNAKFFVAVHDEFEVREAARWAQARKVPWVVLGEGSNLIVSDRGFCGLVIKVAIPGISIVREEEGLVEVEVGGGVIWDQFVDYTVEHGWWGVENLSLIPGTTGATPVQNVGAYGQDVRRVISSVEAYDSTDDSLVVLTNGDCRFGYRRSVFNTEGRGRYVITRVRFVLSKNPAPNLSRAIVRKAVTGSPFAFNGRATNPAAVSQSAIRQVIIRLRSSGKLLPEPDSVGSSGTFFQTRLLGRGEFWTLLRRCLRGGDFSFAGVLVACRIGRATASGFMVPPRPLIRHCKLSEASSNGVSLYRGNCSVVVSAKGSASDDLLELIRVVRTTVHRQTGIIMPIEPTLIGFVDAELRRVFELPRS